MFSLFDIIADLIWAASASCIATNHFA